MTTPFLLLLLLTTSVQGFVLPLFPASKGPLQQQVAPSNTNKQLAPDRFNSLLQIYSSLPQQSAYKSDSDAPLLALNDSSRIDATALAESKKPVGAYQITRPRWYNKAEAAVIVLLVQRLRLLDVRGVEHMLEATDDFRKQDPEDVWLRAIFLMKVAPGANFRTVIQRHPRTLLVPVHKMKRVCEIISDAYPDANMARVVERIPSVFSRNATKLERNVEGLLKYAPEVDSAIFQAAPSMLFLPPHTVEAKVAALRWHLPGMNLRNFLKGMPTALARSQETVPRGLSQLRKRFPTASNKELVRIVESAPSLVRMSGVNGTLDIKVDALMTLLPGVNVTNIISNAPGVLIRSTGSLPSKVEKLVALFPSANVTKMVSRTPGILYLDIDRTVKPKALWIKQAVGLDQDGLDRLIEQGPWLLKAGWGPLARLQFAIDAGIARKDRPAGLVGLVRRSRVAFAAAHHPGYANFLRRRLDEEVIEEEELDAGEESESDYGLHPKAWGRGGSGEGDNSDGRPPFGSSGVLSEEVMSKPTTGASVRATRGLKDAAEQAESKSPPTTTSASRKPTRSNKLKNAGESESLVPDLSEGETKGGVVLDLSEGGAGDGEKEEDEDDLMEKTAIRVGQLEDALGRERKSRMGGVKDRPPKFGQSRLARWQGNPQNGDAFLDLGRGEIVRRDPQIGP